MKRLSGSDSFRSSPDVIRVAVVAPSLAYVGGQAVQADLLMRYWSDDPHIDAEFIPIDPQLPWILRWASHIPFLRTVIREPIYILRLWRKIESVNVVHIFSASYWSFLLVVAPAKMVAKLRGKKTIINYRSGEARDHLTKSRAARRVLKSADRLVVPSNYLVGVFNEFRLNATAIPNVVDHSQFSYRVRAPLRPYLVCTRGFNVYYSVDVVVRAFAEVQEVFPDASLNLVGEGPLESKIRALTEQLGVTNVRFSGPISREFIGECYDRADIFINASWLDNMPVSIIEAFASGTPVVSTSPESIRYLVEHEHTGLLSDTGDSSALAANVIRLLREPQLALRLAANAFEESRRYQWAPIREQWLAVYRGLFQ